MKKEALCFVLEELKPRGAMRAMKNMRRRELPSIFSGGFFWEEGAKYASAFFIGLIPCISRFRKKVLRWRRRCRRNLLNPLCDCLNGGSFSQHRPIFLPITCICCCILLSLSLSLCASLFFFAFFGIFERSESAFLAPTRKISGQFVFSFAVVTGLRGRLHC